MPPLLKLENISKRYPGVVALDDVTFALDSGEVRALLGKNGAGKSTLIKVLSGAVTPDSGQIIIDGKPVVMHSTRDPFEFGIYTVYQEMSLIPAMSVAENIMLGRWQQKRFLGVLPGIDFASIRKIARASLEQLEVDLDLNRPVSQLSIAEQQIVEIAKALSFNPRVFVLDEPTSSLAAHEVDVLHAIVRKLAAQGRAVIYVTHRLQEVWRVADTITVLRDGRSVDTFPVGEATLERITQLMIGFHWKRAERERQVNNGAVKLAVHNLTRAGVLHDISFDVHAGEVVGIAGLLGSGRTELLRAIFGRDPIDSGTITVDGKTVTNPSPGVMKTYGVGLTPEDRKRQGLILSASVQNNMTLASLDRLSQNGILKRGEEKSLAQRMVDLIAIKTPGLQVRAGTLSGGNQQKVVIGNWLNTEPAVLMMDEPTRGIDIQAKEQIFELVRSLAAQGLAVLFVSSELEEILDVCDRILVMVGGRITREVYAADIDLETLLGLAMEEVHA
jgi:ribose transport system ATP-binding protein